MKKSTIKSLISLILITALFLDAFFPIWEMPQTLPKIQDVEAATNNFMGSGSWRAPEGVTSITVEAWGGGGGGGGRGGTTWAAGGGGGGAYARATISVTPGNTYDFTVGSGGSGGTGSTPSDGGDGGDTYWEDGSKLLAAGGKGGSAYETGGLGGSTEDSKGDIKKRGGNGADGVHDNGPPSTGNGGGGGGGADASGDGNDADGITGGDRKNDGGAGGNGSANGNAAAGTAWGGAGGGARRTSNTRNGGNGGGGSIRITYNKNQEFSINSGYYIGDGTSSQSITGLGFSPDFVLIAADASGGGTAMFKTSTMDESESSLITATANLTDSSIVFDSDGFTVGSHASVNSVNIRYNWVAFTGSNCTEDGMFCVGQYTGNAVAPRTIPTGFEPSFVIVKRSTSVAAHFHTASQPDNETLYFINLARSETGNYIKSFSSTGFDIGTTDNADGGIYHFIAFKTTEGVFAEGTYDGNGNDDRNITGLGFKPDIVMVTNATNSSASSTRTVMNTPYSYGDFSCILASANGAPNNIQALLSDGFQVGNHVYVNGLDDTYYWVAFDGVPPPPGVSGTFKMATGTYTGNGSGQDITGLGFQPDLVIIKDNAKNFQVFRTAVMVGDFTAYMSNGAANFSGGITSLNSNGFSVGSNNTVNKDTNTYHYQAFGNAWNSCSKKTGASDFAIGSYTGSGAVGRDILDIPWKPDIVVTKRNASSIGVWRSSAIDAEVDLSSHFSNSAEATLRIQALIDGGFRLGSNSISNGSGSLYFWFAFKSGSGFSTGTYTGNAQASNEIDVGFQPDLVWVKRSTNNQGVSRPNTLEGDNTQYFTDAENISGRIISLLPNGFQVGGNPAETNYNNGIYRWAAWKNVSDISVSVTITTDGAISYGTLGSGESISTIQLSDTQTAKNDGNVPIDLSIKTNVPLGWILGSSPGADTFTHEFSTDGGINWIKFITGDVYQSLASSVPIDGAKDIDFRFTAPDPSASADQKTITITIQAVEH